MKTALGKGLGSLLPDKVGDIITIDIDRIIPGDLQPRKVFRDEALKELAASIREKGVLQPIIVSRTGDGTFRLIAGERRWRASSLAGLKKIPAIIKDVSSADSLEIALIENIQREDLNPVEMASAFNRLMQDFHLTQEQLSARVGKDRATVANYLRLLKLPDEIRTFVNDGLLSMGHARAILSAEGRPSQLEIARRVIHKGLSVRETEGLAKKLAGDTKRKTHPKKKDPQIASLEDRLIRSLGTKVRIHHKGKKGKIEIEYYSLDELDRLLDIFAQEP
ncbi:MAG TPA: ParB/RepB/Spo0J family partition protein [Thermodesulfovibrionales bacterium]|nr:ParB/RepB/Spo0J family partition protein [Thermodesulfovibrionales bacterium]